MIRLMGGDKSFITKLDSLFTMHLPDEFFAETEDVTKEGLLGWLCAWQRTEPPYPVPVYVDYPTLEDPVLAA